MWKGSIGIWQITSIALLFLIFMVGLLTLLIYHLMIFRRQNPLELVFQDISTFDAQNPIDGSFLKEPDVGKKNLASDLVKKAPPAGIGSICKED